MFSMSASKFEITMQTAIIKNERCRIGKSLLDIAWLIKVPIPNQENATSMTIEPEKILPNCM